MDVGVFDLIERGETPLSDLYERRLELAQRYEAGGFYSYHLAEHHSTPHGVAPAPSVFLSALAQRTRRLRFGPMVYLLPYYHPLRLIEEICMLDQLSRGRLDIGFGRGISPLERKIYGIPPENAERLNIETYRILRLGLVNDMLDYDGEFYRFDKIPLLVRPYQHPHPPLWYGTSSLASVDGTAKEGVNLVTSQSLVEARKQGERYWEVRREAGLNGATPHVGLLRKIVVAETDEEAHAIAVRAYPRWLADFNYHHTRAGQVRASADRPPTWDEFTLGGKGVAGAPDTVAAALEQQLRGGPFTYVVAEFFWGAMSYEEVERSVELFSRHVMPVLQVLEAEVGARA